MSMLDRILALKALKGGSGGSGGGLSSQPVVIEYTESAENSCNNPDMYRVSDLTPSLEELLGGYYHFANTGRAEEITVHNFSYIDGVLVNVSVSPYPDIVVAYTPNSVLDGREGTPYEALHLEVYVPGIYIKPSVISKIEYNQAEKIDAKHLPGFGGVPGRMLVTNGDGEAVWEERTHYPGQTIKLQIKPGQGTWVENGQYYGIDMNDPDHGKTMEAINADLAAELYNTGNWSFDAAMYWDGVRYEYPRARPPVTVKPGDTWMGTTYPFGFQAYQHGSFFEFVLLYADDGRPHAFEWEKFAYPLKKIDEKYLPDPVVHSPSGKKFKITVADDGTLSATEVTA